MKLPTNYVPEITRDVQTDMLVVGTALQVKIDSSTFPLQKQAIFKQPQQFNKTPSSTTPNTKSSIITPSTPKLSKAQIRTLITPTSPPSSLPKTLPPKPITSISTSKFLTTASYRHKYTPSIPSPLRLSTLSTPLIPSKPTHLSSAPVSPSSSTTSSRSSSPSQQSHHHRALTLQRRHRLLFNLLLPTLLKSLITVKIADEILERRRVAEARDRDMWERYVLQEADHREMKVGRSRLRMMSVWLDLKCLVTEGSGFVFEENEGGDQRDERLDEEDGEVEWFGEMEGQWREGFVVDDVEGGDFW